MDLFLFVYLITLVFSLANFKKFVDTPLRFFPLLIAYTLFNEILGYFIINFEEFSFFEEEEYNWHNVIIYNVYQLVFFGYLFWLYHKVVKNQLYRKLIRITAILTFLSYTVSLFYQNPFHSSLYYADCVGCMAVSAAVLLHFNEIRQVNGGINRYNLMVWINWGVLIFSVFFPFYILSGYRYVDFYLEYHLRQMLWVVICIMYGLFTIGFVVSKRKAFR